MSSGTGAPERGRHRRPRPTPAPTPTPSPSPPPVERAQAAPGARTAPEETQEGRAAGTAVAAGAGDRTVASAGRIGVSASAQIVGSLVAGLLTMLGLRLLTGQLGTEDYGRYVILASYVTVAAIIVDLGLNGITYRDIARDPAAAGRIIGTNLGLRSALCVVAMPVVVALVYLAYPDQRGALFVPSLVLVVDVYLTVVQTTVLSYYGARVRSEVLAAVLVLGRLLFVGGLYAAVLAGGLGLRLAVVVYVAADAATALVSVVLVHTAIRIRLRFEPRAWASTFRRALPLGVMQLLNTLYLYIDGILLSLLGTNRAVALYGLCFNAIAVAAGFSNMFASALVPNLAVAGRDRLRRTIDGALRVTTYGSVPLAVGGVLVAREIVVLLGGDAFAAARVPFLVLSLSLLASFPRVLLSYAAVATERFRRMPLVTAAVLAVNVVANLALIPAGGSTGAAVALVVSEAVALALIFVLISRELGFRPRLAAGWRAVPAGAAMLGAGSGVRHLGLRDSIAGAAGCAAVGLAVYALVLLVLDPALRRTVRPARDAG